MKKISISILAVMLITACSFSKDVALESKPNEVDINSEFESVRSEENFPELEEILNPDTEAEIQESLDEGPEIKTNKEEPRDYLSEYYGIEEGFSLSDSEGVLAMIDHFRFKTISPQLAKELGAYPGEYSTVENYGVDDYSFFYTTNKTPGMKDYYVSGDDVYFGPIYQVTPDGGRFEFKYKLTQLPNVSKSDYIKSLGQAVDVYQPMGSALNKVSYVLDSNPDCIKHVDVYFGDEFNVKVQTKCFDSRSYSYVQGLANLDQDLINEYYFRLGFGPESISLAYEMKLTDMSLEAFQEMYKDVKWTNVYKEEKNQNSNYELVIGLNEKSPDQKVATTSFYKVEQSIQDSKIKTISSERVDDLDDFNDLGLGFTLSIKNEKLVLEYNDQQILDLCENPRCIGGVAVGYQADGFYTIRTSATPSYVNDYVFNSKNKQLIEVGLIQDIHFDSKADEFYVCTDSEMFSPFVKKFNATTGVLISSYRSENQNLKCVGFNSESSRYEYLEIPYVYDNKDLNALRASSIFDYYDFSYLPNGVSLNSL